MALIQCPNCGKEISDKAQSCVYCGCIFSHKTKKTCPECGNELEQNVSVCPQCGYPMDTVDTQKPAEDGTQISVGNDNENASKSEGSKRKKKKITLTIFVVLLIAALAFGYVQKQRSDYAENLYQATYFMQEGCIKAEDTCNLIQKTWNNAIWKKSDKETNKYTKAKGVFVSDFNDALDRLFEDEDFVDQLREIVENQSQVNAYVKALQNPPKKFQAGYQKITELYEAYLKFTNMALSPTGSLNSFAEDFEEIDKETAELLSGMRVYIE